MTKAGKKKGPNNYRLPGAGLIDKILELNDQGRMTPQLAKKYSVDLNMILVRHKQGFQPEALDLFQKVQFLLEPYVQGRKTGKNGVAGKDAEQLIFFSKLFNTEGTTPWTPVEWVHKKNNVYAFSIGRKTYLFEEPAPEFWNGDFGIKRQHKTWNEVKPVYNEKRYKTLYDFYQLPEALLEKKTNAVGWCEPELVKKTDRLPLVHVNNFCLFIQGHTYKNWKGDFKIQNIVPKGNCAFVKPIKNTIKDRVVELFPKYHLAKYGKEYQEN